MLSKRHQGRCYQRLPLREAWRVAIKAIQDADVFATVGTNSTQKTAENKPTEPAAKSEPVGQTYVLNTNTEKFHIPTCRSVKQTKDKNKKDFCGSREEVVAKGYSPYKICNP